MGLQLTKEMRCILAEKLWAIKANNQWGEIKRVNHRPVYLEKDLNYFVVKDTVFDLKKIHLTAFDILQKARNGEYATKERVEYLSTKNRWKSEELMFQCVKKLYPKNIVIHQHRPYFLHTETGRMSYDVFVLGKNLAFEYQGKQHFEPVEYFGGNESFLAQKKRDELKVKISKENGIKLVAINYWETVSTELIKEKIAVIFEQSKSENK